MNAGIRKTAEIAPLGVRMQPALKEALFDAARRNGRSLNAEVVLRLEQSFESGKLAGLSVEQPVPPYSGRPLSAIEQTFLDVVRKLPPEKQLALISLFK